MLIIRALCTKVHKVHIVHDKNSYGMYRVFTDGNIITPQPVAQLPTASLELTPQPVAQMSGTPLDYISLVPYYALRVGKVVAKDKREIVRRLPHDLAQMARFGEGDLL